MRDSNASLTAALAEYWSGVRLEDLPEDVVRAAKRHLLDTLAAGVAGAGAQVVAAAREAMTFASGPEHGQGSAVLWGGAARLPPVEAALVNGTASHALELDDFHGCGHSGAVVVPVVFALAEHAGADGREALTAIVAGYDLAARVLEGAGGYHPHNERGWHSTGTCGSFGAAAAAARLLSLDAARFTHALGIAGSFTGGIWAFLVDGAMTKRFHPGKAAETGLSAALLARSGMTGPRFVLEAEWGGFFSTYAGETATPEATLAGLGVDFRILRSGIKPHACCRGMHGSIDSLLELMSTQGFDGRSIERLIVHGNEHIIRQFGRHDVDTLLAAQFSLPYSLAVAATSGRATLDQYLPRRSGEPEIKRLMAATEVVADRKLRPGENPVLEVHLRDGRRFSHQTDVARGGPERPLSDEEVVSKAESLMVPVLGEARFQKLLTLVLELERVNDMRELTGLLASTSSPSVTGRQEPTGA